MKEKPPYEWPGLIHYWPQILCLITFSFLPSAIGNYVRFMKTSWQFMIDSF